MQLQYIIIIIIYIDNSNLCQKHEKLYKLYIYNIKIVRIS